MPYKNKLHAFLKLVQIAEEIRTTNGMFWSQKVIPTNQIESPTNKSRDYGLLYLISENCISRHDGLLCFRSVTTLSQPNSYFLANCTAWKRNNNSRESESHLYFLAYVGLHRINLEGQKAITMAKTKTLKIGKAKQQVKQ